MRKPQNLREHRKILKDTKISDRKPEIFEKPGKSLRTLATLRETQESKKHSRKAGKS